MYFILNILNINMTSAHRCDLQGYQLDKLLAFMATVYYIVNKINQSMHKIYMTNYFLYFCFRNGTTVATGPGSVHCQN